MRKLFLFVALLLVLMPFVAEAQVVLTELQGQRPVLPLPKLPPTDKELLAAKCGDHFLYFPASTELPPGPRIAYWIQPVSAGNGEKVNMVMAFLKMKFRVLLDESKKSPTSELVISQVVAGQMHEDGKRTMHAIFNPNDIDEILLRMSAADYKKAARCLPPPSRFR